MNSAVYQARKAEIKACFALTRGYEHDRATLREMREYASCIDKLHPEPLIGAELYAVKFAVLVIFIACIAGAVWELRHRTFFLNTIGSLLFGALVGTVLSLILLTGLWALIGGLTLVLS